MIKAQDLFFQFDKRGIAGVHGVSLSISEGEIIGIMGPNGSGKTTLLKLLSGIIHPQKGNCHRSGEVASFPKDEFNSSMNVQTFLINSIQLELEIEKKVQLARDLADTFDFTFQLRQNLNELSSGQKQKVLLSKELISRPSILFLDEPFSHLDPFTRRDILDSLFTYIKHQKITVLWVTHDLNEAFKYSDRVGILNFGKIEQLDTPLQLIKSPKNIFVAQFMGYRNFVYLKKSQDFWNAPWGRINLNISDKTELLMVVPDEAWNFSNDGIEMKIINIRPGKQRLEYEMILGDQKYFMCLSPHQKSYELSEIVKLLPDLSQTFVISL